MKKFIIYIIALLIMTPQMVHSDTIVYDDIDTHLCSGDMHKDTHHNDSEHDKHTKHHHHCTVEISNITVFLNNTINYEIKSFISSKHTKINFYKSLHTSRFIGSIFQPPRC